MNKAKTFQSSKCGLIQNFYMTTVVVVFPATSAWGFSKSWGGGIPTSDIDHSTPRLLSLNITILHSPSTPPFSPLPCLGIHLPLFPTTSLSVAIPHQILLISPTSHLLSQCEAPPTLELPPTCQSPASAARPCCLRLPPFLCRCVPPFAALGLHPGPCCPLGGSPGAGPPAPLCPCLILPEVFSKSWHCPFLDFCWVPLYVSARGQYASTPWKSLALAFAPTINWTFRCRSG